MSQAAIPFTGYKSLYVGGDWIAPPADSVEAVVNPATEGTLGVAPVGRKQEAEMAVAAARDAFDNGLWPRMSHKERIAKLRPFCEFLRQKREEIVALIVAETGKTINLARPLGFDTALQISEATFDLAAAGTERLLPLELNPSPAGGKMLGAGVVVREPYGVVSIITPYNFPFFMSFVKALQAMVMGNTVVVKPSPYTPYEVLVLAEAAHHAGLPRGVFNVVTGGTDVGTVLTSDKRVDMVSFTGSDVVGAAIQAQAAPTLKKVMLELGGKSALVVCADANLEEAAAFGAGNIIFHAGQACGLNTRQIVHNSVREKYVDLMAGILRSVALGDPTQTSTAMGPLIREVQRRKVEAYIEIALQEGCRLVTGGRRPGDLGKGYFFEPTIFHNVSNKSRVAREEIFGPVGVVIGVDSDDDAIAAANDSEFGLCGAVYSSNVGHAYELAQQIRTGNVAINGGTGAFSPNAPFGGIKRSGYGREYGIEGLHEYSYAKAISFHGG